MPWTPDDVPDWWVNTVDDFVAELETQGIVTCRDDVRFTGFWSQGDGASFTGHIRLGDFMEAFDLKQAHPHWAMLASAVEDFGDVVEVKIVRTGTHYVHENTIGVTVDLNDQWLPFKPVWDPVKVAVARECFKKAEVEPWEVFEKLVQDKVRERCRDLYRRLEKLYEEAFPYEEGVA